MLSSQIKTYLAGMPQNNDQYPSLSPSPNVHPSGLASLLVRWYKMNPASFIRVAARRGVASQSVRAFASKAPPPPPRATSSSTPKENTAAQKQESSAQDVLTQTPISALPSLDFIPGEEPNRERTGAKSSKDSLSSIERKRRFWGRVSMGMLALGAGAVTWHAGREWEEDELREMRMVRGTHLTSGGRLTLLHPSET